MTTPEILRRLAAGATALALLAGTAGCAGTADSAEPTDGTEPTDGLVIVVGARSNTPPPALVGAAADAREAALVAESHLSIVVADGAPYQLEGAGALIARDANAVVQQQDRDRNRALVDALLAEAVARTPESDLLGALDLAGRSLGARSGDRTLVVIDSGLSTAGALDLAARPELLDADAGMLVAGLDGADALPDLSGVSVVFTGLGDVAPPQPPLPAAQRTRLVELWTRIAEAAGAAHVRVDETPISGQPSAELPPVTPVAMGAGAACTVQTVVLDEGDVAFQADSARFRDRVAAAATVEPVARQILAGDLSAALTGTTADVGDPAGQRRLSEERAQAVMALLADEGVPADRMTATGVGSDFAGYDPDDLAANRAVRIELTGVAGVACG